MINHKVPGQARAHVHARSRRKSYTALHHSGLILYECTGCVLAWASRVTHRPVVHAPGVVRFAPHSVRPCPHAAQHRPAKCCQVRAGPVQVAKVVGRQGGPAQRNTFAMDA